MIRFDKLTVKAQEALQAAQEIGARHDQQQVEPLHLLAALVEQRDGVVPPLLGRLGVRTEVLSGDMEAGLERLPPKGAIVLALPMKIDGGTGGPCRIIAILPE